jgi:hypothetical protein
MTISTTFRKDINSLSPRAPIYLLEITNDLLVEPIRLSTDFTQTFVVGFDQVVGAVKHQGNFYYFVGMTLQPPSDPEQSIPTAKLSIDNLSRENMQWLENSSGGRGSKVTIKQIYFGTPEVIEYQTTLRLYSVTATITGINIDLAYADIYNTPGVRTRYNKATAPGIF